MLIFRTHVEPRSRKVAVSFQGFFFLVSGNGALSIHKRREGRAYLATAKCQRTFGCESQEQGSAKACE